MAGTVRPEEAKVFDSEAGYHRFKSDDGSDYGSFEVFWKDMVDPRRGLYDVDEEDEVEAILAAGWYWWACFPGCMPDGDPMGPFASSSQAKADALDE